MIVACQWNMSSDTGPDHNEQLNQNSEKVSTSDFFFGLNFVCLIEEHVC